MTITKRQHFLPNFILKRWSFSIDKSNFKFKVYDKNQKKTKIISSRKNNDPFFEEYFYELSTSDFKLNEIENKLSEIEKEFSIVTRTLLDNWEKYKTIKITRKQLIILKLFMCLQIVRSNDIFTKSKNLDGDAAFNEIFKNFSSDEIKNIQLKEIDFLYNFFSKVMREEPFDQLWKMLEPVNSLESKIFLSTGRIFKSILENSFVGFYEIDKETVKERNFILTDSGPIQATGQFTSIPLVNFYPLTPNICIVLTNIWLDEKTTLPLLKEDKIYFNSFFDNFDIWKRNYRTKYIEGKRKTNMNDEFIYDKKLFELKQIKLINSLIFSQCKSHIVFLNEDDYKDILDNVYRIEERNR